MNSNHLGHLSFNQSKCYNADSREQNSEFFFQIKTRVVIILVCGIPKNRKCKHKRNNSVLVTRHTNCTVNLC